MAVTINADTVVGGAIVTSDASGVLELQAAGSTKLTVNGSGVALSAPLPIGSGGTGGSATPTAGGIVYGTGTAQAVSVAGTSGQVLTSAGSGAPTWTTLSASPWVVLSSGTISSVTAVDFETGFTDSSYIAIVIILNNVFSNGSGNASFRFKQAGSYTASGYYSQTLEASGSSVSGSRNSNQAQMVFSGAQVLNTSSYNAVLIMNNRFNTTAANPSLSTLNQAGSGVADVSFATGANYSVGGAVTGVRFLLSGGGGSTTIVSGNYTSYGIKAA
jgi:hypothetical protein